MTASSKRLEPCNYLELRERVLAAGDKPRAAIKLAADRIELTSRLQDLERSAWHNFGDKPLFANMAAGEMTLGPRYAHMWNSGMFDSRKMMAGDGWEIGFRAKDQRAEGENAYFGKGADAIAFNDKAGQAMTPEMKGYPANIRPAVAYMRLFTIRKIAINLEKALPAIFDAREIFTKADTPSAFRDAGERVKSALGIGLTTAFHGLADMGYEVIKPDIHVTKTLAHFGHIADPMAFDDPGKYMATDTRKAECVFEAVTLARKLNRSDLLPEFRGNACREVDIVLMQASLHDVILSF